MPDSPTTISLGFNYLKYVLPRRRRLQALGLTVNGKSRQHRSWPKLAGLDRKSYGQRYMQLRRMEGA